MTEERLVSINTPLQRITKLGTQIPELDPGGEYRDTMSVQRTLVKRSIVTPILSNGFSTSPPVRAE